MMEHTYWHRQTADKPLFPDMLWSQPESRATSGKLLIVGGSLHGFAAPAEAYAHANKAGIGTARVLLPDAVKKLIGPVLESGEFAPSTPSGSFSKKALAELMDHASWADGFLIAGELDRNSETAILLEQFITKYTGPLTITRDAVDYFKNTALLIAGRPQTVIVLSMGQLQKLCASVRLTTAVTLSMDLVKLVESLHDLSDAYPCGFITKHHNQMVVSCGGEVSSTKISVDMPVWRVRTAARAAVWHLQNPTRMFEALSTSIISMLNQPNT